MKHVIASALVVLALLTAGGAYARNVSEQEAKAAAAYFMMHNSHHEGLTANDVQLVYQIDNPTLATPACYFFNVGKEGWVIMSASAATDAVIGFSDEGWLDADCLPENMMWYIGQFADMIIAVQNADLTENYPDADEWVDLNEHRLKGNTKDSQVVLMRTSWAQGNPNHPTYNTWCPQIDGKYCYTGCVATALAQICKYYSFPKNPVGRPSYMWNGENLTLRLDTIFFDYSLMPNKLTSSSTAEQVDEVAKLMYAIGVTVHMGYGIDGSGAYSSSVPGWMQNYFRYKRGSLKYRNTVGDSTFLALIRDDLMKRRPVYMGGASSIDGGQDADGHAWVCAGYMSESDQRYFMNWGWDGSGNGFFNLKGNNMPVQGYNFQLHQECITGIIPPSADSTDIDFVGISEVEPSADLQPAYPNPALFSVTLPYILSADADMVVYAVDGTVVESRRIKAGEGKAVVDVRNLPAGIYVYRLGGATGKFVVR